MALSIITGSDGLGKYLEGSTPDILKVVTSLTSMNNPKALANVKGMDFLKTFIREVQGVQGHTEAYKANQAFVTDDGSYQDSIAFQETYGHWTFTRRGYTVKDKDFTHAMLREADERNIPLSSLVNDRIAVIMKLYINNYLPNVAYEALFQLPTITGGSYYSEPRGFLKGQVVPEHMLKPGVDATVARNHYRCIADGTAGLTVEDLDFVVEYLSEYVDISDSNIIAIGTRHSLFQLGNAIGYEGNKDIFMRTGQPTTEFLGVRFITNDFMPRNVILFLDGDAPELITKLISPKENYRGMSIVKESGFLKLDDISDLVGSHFKIQPEGYHLTGRHYGLFLDIDADRGATNREMGAAGLAIVKGQGDVLRNRWYKGLR